MSIENNLKRIADALEALVKQETLITEAVAEIPATTAPVPPAAPVAQAAPAPIQQAPIPPAAPVAPVAQAAPAPIQQAPIPPAAPVAPAPAAPMAPASPSTVPFNNSEELMKFVMEKYKALGPEKGGEIQKVLVSLGYGNINEIQPDKYQMFFDGVNAIS